ncbi:MAG: ribosomal-processing cysteine protease Prp [Lachnospiraceae bacterium]|nr:ribosomal-processing cysteine protease Prp [Lachnospiraceae bacterium]MDY5742505.1 ribosomal-processing cysteine protease Prp [Lachnospiraceae bacterium]
MVKVVVFRKNDSLVGFEMSGHADPAKKSGEDIVCAYLSAIPRQLYLGLTNLTDNRPNIRERAEDGYVHCMLSEPISEQAALLMQVFYLTVKDLESGYSKFVKVTIEEV